MNIISDELLFFDTFSHEINDDIKLDLVQFPKPVYITEIRIIPLGARVQADFPGGVRLGATNPSKFDIEFFANNLGKPGASSFEPLGKLEYNQNNCIHLDCETTEELPTDGLVLRGWYTTITLAVYGTLTKNLAEQIASPPITPTEVTCDPEEEVLSAPIELIQDPSQYDIQEAIVFEEQPPTEIRPTLYSEENFYPNQESGVTSSQRLRKKSLSSERSLSRNRTYSSSNDREYSSSKKRDWSRSPEYRHSRRVRSSRRDSDSHGENSKRPRSPYDSSPPRPQSPDEYDCDDYLKGKLAGQKLRERAVLDSPEELTESIQLIDDDTPGEQFEPILSDDEILGDDDSQGIINATPTTIEPEDIEMEELIDYEAASKLFDPFKIPLSFYEVNLEEICLKDLEILRKMFIKFSMLFKFTSIKDFLFSTDDEKECFVNLSESLLNQLNHINSLKLNKRAFIINKIFQVNGENLKLASIILKIALNFECAYSQPQPGYKIRHIKIGPRIAELLLSSSLEFFKYYCEIERMDPFKSLFDLFLHQNMALSIKLLILRTIYALLDSKYGLNIFLHSNLNGYQNLLILLQKNPPTRVKFAIKSVINKINLFESLETIRELSTKLFVLTNVNTTEEDFEKLGICIEEVLKAVSYDALSYQQPKRFLPVSSKYEIIRDPGSYKSWVNMLQLYFKEHHLNESLLLIMTNQNDVPQFLLTRCLDLITVLTKSQLGIDYFVDDTLETTQLLVKCLLGLDDDIDDSQENEVDTTTEDVEKLDEKMDDDGKMEDTIDSPKPSEDIKEKSPEIEPVQAVRLTHIQKLGLEIAFKIQARYHVDAITNNRDNIDILCDHLYALYGQTVISHPVRIYTTEYLSFNGNLNPFLAIIEKERKIQSKRQQDSPGAKYKSPSLSLSVDILDCCVRYCNNIDYLKNHCATLLDLVKNHGIFEPSVSAVLQEMAVYLKPLEVAQNFSHNDVIPVSDVITRSIEYITTFPGDLIMGLRILKRLCFGKSELFNSNYQTKELKLRWVTLQFYQHDGILTLLKILEKINQFFEQPGIHAPLLTTIQGINTCEILLPTLEILRDILTFLIQSRDTRFRDLTALEPLIKTYFLMYYFPESSQNYDDSLKIRSEIIKILLAYTQPNEEGEEFVHKSLWTQMMKEVIKNVLHGPSTFIPGLKLLAELIPLPLPIPTLKPMTDMECQRYITERKLWSAHLHPDRNLLIELIQTICPTSFHQLSDLLIRVCLQLADLAPNMTLLVSKTVTDLIVNEYFYNSVDNVGTTQLARLLNFLAQLTIYPSVKISTLSIFPGKLFECFTSILSCNNKSEAHQLCQTNVHRVLETFFDSEISMINIAIFCENLELNLASALPAKELIPDLVHGIFNSLLNFETISSQAALRNLILLTEHDITFYHLRINLLARKLDFQQWLTKFVEYLGQSLDKGQISNLILFLRNLIVIDETLYATVPVRNLSLYYSEFRHILNWITIAEQHPLRKLKLYIARDELSNKEALLPDITDLIDKLDSSSDQFESSSLVEPNLPQAEGIVTLYLSRAVFVICENLDDVQLNSNYWLEPLRLDEIVALNSMDMVQTNLSELVTMCLPPDTNLSSECKRILHLSASPQSNRERTTTAPCFRTRRVEVEPNTGRPEKKIFVSPMRGRGFPRANASRGDLFRSRPPNTSRPPSLHVDDFLALETCGAQPTGPTGYNKLSRDIIGIRSRGRGRARIGNIVGGTYRKPFRGIGISSPYGSGLLSHFRTATSEPLKRFTPDPHYPASRFGSPGTPRARGRGRGRPFFVNK